MPYKGEIAALTAVFLWGGTAILFEAAGKRVGAFSTNLTRIILATLMLSATLFLQSGHLLPIDASSNQIFWLGLSGIVGLAIGDGALFICFVILGARLSTLFLSLAPVFAAFLAWIYLGENLGRAAILGILLTIAGTSWVVYEKSDEEIRGSKTRGIILGIIAALGQGVGVILAKYGFRTEIDALSATILRMVPAALVLMVFSFLTGRAHKALTVIKDRRAVWFILAASVIGPYLGVWLANVAVKYTEAGIAATLLATVPIVVIPMVWVTHGRRPSLRAVVGTCVAVFGVALIFLR